MFFFFLYFPASIFKSPIQTAVCCYFQPVSAVLAHISLHLEKFYLCFGGAMRPQPALLDQQVPVRLKGTMERGINPNPSSAPSQEILAHSRSALWTALRWIHWIYWCAGDLCVPSVWKESKASLSSFLMRMSSEPCRESWAVSGFQGRWNGQEKPLSVLPYMSGQLDHRLDKILFFSPQFLNRDFLPFTFFGNNCGRAALIPVISGRW